MVLMALDHANHFVAHKHSSGEMWGGAFPFYNDGLTFLLRFVTHLAAPGFFLLMGMGMVIFAHIRRNHGWREVKILTYLWGRGIVLILLQFLVVNRAWALSTEGWNIEIYIGVLCALGGTLILASLFLQLPVFGLCMLAVVLCIGVEFLHPGPALWGRISQDPANVIFIYPGGTAEVWSYYPILPWLELVIFGMALGKWLIADSERSYARMRILGLTFLTAFVILRVLDGFGNIRPRMGDTWIDFLNLVKYPPSMTFTLMTTGINVILLWTFSRVSARVQRILQPLVVFGRAPLFFYVLHLFLYASLGRLVPLKGISIPAMLPVWIFGLIILYPLCLWYARFKHNQSVSSPLRVL